MDTVLNAMLDSLVGGCGLIVSAHTDEVTLAAQVSYTVQNFSFFLWVVMRYRLTTSYSCKSQEPIAGLLVIDPSRLQRPKFEMACRLISNGVRVLAVLNLLLRHSYLDLLMNNHDILKGKEV